MTDAHTPKAHKCACGKVIGIKPGDPRSAQTLGARIRTHERFCDVLNPEGAAEARLNLAKRMVKSRGQRLRVDKTAERRAPDGAEHATVAPVGKVDFAAAKARIDAERASGHAPDVIPKVAVEPGTDATVPVVAPVKDTPPVAQVAGGRIAPVAPTGDTFKTKAIFDPTEWQDLAHVIHEAESALASTLARDPRAGMPDATHKALDSLLSKLLRIVWDDLSIANSVKVLIGLYIVLQASYIGQAAKQGMDAKKRDERQREAEREAEGGGQ